MIKVNHPAIEPSRYDEYEKKTIETYDSVSKEWAIAHEIVNDWEEEFKYFKKAFLSTGNILDVGCGSGRDIKLLTELGYDCTGVDASKRLLEIAKDKKTSAKFHHLNIYNLKQINQRFDGFICMAVLLHIPRVRVNEALRQIKSTLKHNAVGIITTIDGEGEYFEVREADGRHEERLFVYWTKDDFESVLKNNDFEVIKYSMRSIGRRDWHCFMVKNLR